MGYKAYNKVGMGFIKPNKGLKMMRNLIFPGGKACSTSGIFPICLETGHYVGNDEQDQLCKLNRK